MGYGDYKTVGYYLRDDSIVCAECCHGPEVWESGYDRRSGWRRPSPSWQRRSRDE